MKREGRQRGMVRTQMVLPHPYNPRPNKFIINQVDSRPTAGWFTKVQAKPTNHSKFSDKCGRARFHPCGKSRDKSKGSHKMRSHDVLSNYRLVTWRIVDGHDPGFNFSGFSASGILDHLVSRDYIDDDMDYTNYYDDDDDDNFNVGYIYDDTFIGPSSTITPIREIEQIHDHGHQNHTGNDHYDDQEEEEEEEVDDDGMSFCDVGFLLDQVEGDEGWCLVTQLI